MVPVKDRRRGGVEQRSVPVWLFPRVSFRPFSPDLNKECHGCTAWKILTTGDIQGLAAASPEGAEDIRQAAAPRGFPRAVSGIWTAAITGEQLLLAITLGSLLSPKSRQQAEVFADGLLHCPSPAFLHGGTLFVVLSKSSCQPQQYLTQPRRVGSFQAGRN